MKNYRHLRNVALLHLNTETCVGCGVCVDLCPHGVFVLEREKDKKKARIADFNGCMECGACATNCPVEAITVNPSDGCGCAVYIIQSWIKGNKHETSSCGC